MGQNALVSLSSSQIPTPNNRWQGGNRGAWSSPDYDRVLGAFNTTLEHGERVAQVRQMLRIFSEDLPWVTLFFRADSIGYAVGVTGLTKAAPESNIAWNINEWEFK
jgi:ABC-type transport system substrate-binding protein